MFVLKGKKGKGKFGPKRKISSLFKLCKRKEARAGETLQLNCKSLFQAPRPGSNAEKGIETTLIRPWTNVNGNLKKNCFSFSYIKPTAVNGAVSGNCFQNEVILP